MRGHADMHAAHKLSVQYVSAMWRDENIRYITLYSFKVVDFRLRHGRRRCHLYIVKDG